MRSFLLTLLSVCLSLVLPCAAWAQGAVYAMTNAIHNNQIVVWSRAADGTLKQVQTISTHGGGSGFQASGVDGLGSQGGLILDAGHRLLLAVNTETAKENLSAPFTNTDCNQGTISSFLVRPNGRLIFVGKFASGGLFPDSLTVRGGVLYVLNAGGGAASGCGTTPNVTPNVTGFLVAPSGRLIRLPFSTRTIDPGNNTGGEDCPASFPSCGTNPPFFARSASQVSFTPAGTQVVVTVKGTNSIYVFPYKFGYLGQPKVTQATGTLPTYFGFAFDAADHMIVAEPFGTASSADNLPKLNASAASSFTIAADGSLTPNGNLDVANGQTASCWVAVDPTSNYAYLSNNLSNNISPYTIAGDGSLSHADGSEIAAAGPNDEAVVRDAGENFLYVLNAGNGTVGAYQINADGSLSLIATYAGLPGAGTNGAGAGAQGLAAY